MLIWFSVNGVAFTSDNKQDKPFTSMPTALIFCKRASTNVVPEPQKGSKTMSPFFANFSKIVLGNCGGNFAGYGCIE